MLDSGGGGGKVDFVADTVAGGAAGSALVGTQTKFSVDPEQAKKLIDGLNEALDELNKLNRTSEQLQGMNAPGKDVYSGSATQAVRTTAGTDPGGYAWANKMAREALENTIGNIKAALEQYQQNEAVTSTAFKKD